MANVICIMLCIRTRIRHDTVCCVMRNAYLYCVHAILVTSMRWLLSLRISFLIIGIWYSDSIVVLASLSLVHTAYNIIHQLLTLDVGRWTPWPLHLESHPYQTPTIITISALLSIHQQKALPLDEFYCTSSIT